MTETTASSHVEPGHVLADRYRVERVLANGGMSVIVQGTDIVSDRRVAIKTLPIEATRVATSVERFERECHVLDHLQGDHTVEVIAHGRLATGEPYLVMEFLEGMTLSELVRERGPLPVTDAVDYVLQACEVLARAHTAGIIHRDVTPSNMIVTRKADGAPWIKVLDFGLSKTQRNGGKARERSLTFAGEVMGSPHYMAPEQLLSSGTVDQGADIWSIGVVLYELLGGALPFTGETVERIRANVMTEPPRPLSALRPEVPAELEAVILRCLRKVSKERYLGVAVLAASLAQFGGASSRRSVDRILAMAPSRRPPPLPRAPMDSGPDQAAACGRVVDVFSFDGPIDQATAARPAGARTARATSWSMQSSRRARSARRTTLLAVGLVFFTIGMSIGAVYSVWDRSNRLAKEGSMLHSRGGG